MIEFKLFDNPEQSSYFSDIFEDDQDIFNSYVRPKFLQEVRDQSGVKKQAGYSKTRNCHFVSLILVCHNTGDCEFDGHSFKNRNLL